MKKLLLVSALLIGVGVLLSATGQGEESTSPAAEPVTVTWWDWSDSMAPYAEAMFAKFEEENPDIDVEYTLYTIEQLNNAVRLAARSDDFPDISAKPSNMQFMQAVEAGWYQPMNRYIDELWVGGLDAFMARYPADAFMEGLNVLDGDVYTAPKHGSQGFSALLYYNKDLLVEAGLDPENPPTTWEGVREAARLITEAGNGEYYGFIEGGNQLNRWQASVEALAATKAGIHEDGLDYRTGRYVYDNGAYEDAIRFFRQIDQDGSFYPGYLSIDAREARALFGLGQAGFLFQGHWCVGVWRKDNPDLNFGVMFPPIPADGRGGYVYGAPLAQQGEMYMLSATTEHPEQAMRLYLYRTTDEFIEGRVQSGDGFSPLPELNTKENFAFEQLFSIASEAESAKRIPPIPALRDPAGVGAIENEFQMPSPGIREIAQGAVTGQVTDVSSALAALTEALNAELDRAIAAAVDKGVDVSRDLYVFPNWRIGEDYTQEYYDELE
jgi:multiple sugar transport system substrate-binding protein